MRKAIIILSRAESKYKEPKEHRAQKEHKRTHQENYNDYTN